MSIPKIGRPPEHPEAFTIGRHAQHPPHVHDGELVIMIIVPDGAAVLVVRAEKPRLQFFLARARHYGFRHGHSCRLLFH